jgi:hypothetical protein
MKDNTNQSAENALSRQPSGDMHGAEAAHTKTWSDLSANLWSGQELLQLPRDSQTGAGLSSQGVEAPAMKAGTANKTADAPLPPLELGDFKAEALKVYDKLDTNHQGFVSTEQMAVAIQNDPSIKGQDAAALAALYEVKHGEQNNFVPADLNSSVITPAEIQGLPDSLSQEQSSLNDLRKITALDKSGALDTNNDGRVSEAEVSKAMGGQVGAEYGQLAQNYAAKHLDPAEQAQVSQNGLTTSELQSMDRDERFRVYEAANITGTLHNADRSLTSTQNTEAFQNTQNPVESIKQNDVDQGRAGDCYFDSALASVAATQPETIRNSIKENNNGSYTVTFKGDPEHPINVPAPTDAELSLYNAASPDGIWPNIMEKAFADHQVLFGHRVIDNDTAQDAVSGGRGGTALALLTGEATTDVHLNQGQAFETEATPHGIFNSPLSQLETAAAQGDDAVVGVGNVTDGSPLPGHHVYSVVGYRPGADGGTFELRNPWGEQNRTDGDYFSIPADQLAPSINQVAYAPPSP